MHHRWSEPQQTCLQANFYFSMLTMDPDFNSVTSKFMVNQEDQDYAEFCTDALIQTLFAGKSKFHFPEAMHHVHAQ
ncbi:MAG: hypothetical protein CME32_13390 [Gimesia sp.]|jgi:hypothetical protein|nr:hypothetical protein [Gimesia sp.]QDT88093.1 hypothetical protein MalM14_57880 [Gimesia chilikensis]